MKKGIQNSYSTFPSSVNMRYGNYMSNGGAMNQLTEFNEGGRHEENGLGGIPQGMNPDGQMNLVEEGETKFDAENYIFSDTLKVDKELAKAFNLSPKMIGKTFADASKMAGRKKSRREGDKIEEAANEADLMNLMEAQEAFKQKEIEERLTEISQLDPTVLPALMGQGQDPNMMQEAPMDEQAMMEQQMMAEQQGQPSPEEMAMMQQQQDMAMGQQEGMMRSGGKIPKLVLLSRAKSHMSDAAAQEYVKNYGGGGYISRSYAPGGFMGMNMANAGMMNTGAMGTSADLEGCMCADGSTHTSCCQQGYEGGSQAGIATKDYQGMFRGRKLPFRHRRTLKKADVNLAQGEKVFEKGLTGSGGLRATSPANWANLDLSGYTQEQQDQILNSELLRKDPAAFSELNPDLLSKEDLKQVSKVKAALEWTPPAQEAGFSFTPSVPDDGSTRGGDGSGTLRGPGTGSTPVIRTDHNFTKLGKFAHNIQPWNWTRDKLVRSNPTKFAKWSGYRSGLNKFGGNLMQSDQEAGLNSMQGMNQLMRGGGKMCYGCGGAMHNYGGRMDGVQHKYGAGMKTAGTVLDTVADFAKFIPVVGQVVAPIAEAGANVLQGAGEAKATDTAYSWKDAAFDAGSGAAGTFVPGAEQAIQAAGDIATKKEKTAEMQKKQEILNDPSHPDHEQVKKAMEDRSTDKSLQNAETFANVWNKTAGMASKFISPGENVDDIGEAMDTLPIEGIETIPQVDSIPDMNFARYGKKLYGKGGGLWANIHAKRARIAAGSGESMRKPGSEGAPTAEALKNSQNAMGGRLYYPGGYLFGPAGEMPSTPIPDPTEKQDGTYGSDMSSSFIDMSTGTNPLGLVSPMYNLGMGLFGQESDLSYPIEKFTFKPFDFTESKNALRRQAAKAMDSLRKTGNTNPANILALKNLNAQTEAAYLERAENINAQREQAAADNNTKLMNKYNKELRELRLKNEAIKDEFIKTGLQDLVGFAEQERENEYMFNFLKTMAPNVVTGSYNSIFDIFNKKDKKDKKD
jgi:hypothetical protein